ncbi:RagB/SusD family nutrient uptake outer membrane protein [Niabella soli]|uniref:Carbohydrate-binding protein SusD n=1 Tax=Niabella soli DSM 19437 TaxID=929713 RepID=W0F190_9BACT|nr:RagB/SusD family nutrient uptake outer membrane protein [Niabella soli]AHF15116.1 carbohydrate-binding protein SusD [Niabella soli DSM 19437]
MKKFIYSAICISSLLITACSKDLTQIPVSSITTNNFYTNANDFTQAVTGAYSGLKAYPDQALWMGELRSDDIAATSDGNRDWQGINNFSPNLTTTAFIVNAWNNNFNAVYNVNNVLDALATKGDKIGNDSLKARFTAELRFLRAFYYFNLVKFYGKLPIIDKVYTTYEVTTIGRSPVSEVYNFIIADLQYAMAHLPVSYSGANIGRATKWAAEGLLGLVYLTKSGPTYNIEGPGLNSNEYDKALALFNDIITNGGFKFAASYPSIFSYTAENNPEVLFDVQFMSTSNGADYPSQLVPGAYWTGLGLSSYDNGYGTATYNVSRNLLSSYRNSAGTATDIRDTFSIRHGFALSTSTPNTLDTTRPFIKKYIDVSRRGTNRADWPVNFIVMRYTDVLMMKAECILHGASGTQADVNSIVAQVRARAGVPALTTDVTLPLLMEERRREFLGEGLRWNDLVREGLAVTTMNAWIASDTLSATINQVMPNYVIYPLPQAELLTAPGLYTQNPGYN